MSWSYTRGSFNPPLRLFITISKKFKELSKVLQCRSYLKIITITQIVMFYLEVFSKFLCKITKNLHWYCREYNLYFILYFCFFVVFLFVFLTGCKLPAFSTLLTIEMLCPKRKRIKFKLKNKTHLFIYIKIQTNFLQKEL